MAFRSGATVCSASGRCTVKVAPSPNVLSMASRPWWRARMCLTMARPRPVPPSARRLPAWLLPAGACAGAAVPPAVLAGAGERLRCRQATVLQQARHLSKPQAFARRLGELRRLDWVVYAKPPFGGPEQVLAYLGHYTHRVAIANSRLLSLADSEVRFTWKDYRAGGKTKVMTLDAGEFIPVPVAHTTGQLPPHPPLRLPRQWRPRRQPRSLPSAARCT